MAAEELIEVKFRLPDGSDIPPSKYNSTTTVAYLKEKIISQWPKGNFPSSSLLLYLLSRSCEIDGLFYGDF